MELSFIEKLNEAIAEFKAELAVGLEKDNKSAFRRARVASLKLAKLMQEFRKNSPK